MARYKSCPAEFVREILLAKPDEWQEQALRALAHKPRVAIRSGHGVGKSCLESWAILWFLFTRYFPKVVATAPTIRQLYDILWAELSKWLKRSTLLTELFEWQKTKVVLRAEPERWFAVARTAAKPENMQGFHERSILFVLDEASGIADEIFEAIEGALTTPDAKLLICGNPTRNSGFFKRAFFEERQEYHTLKISSAECGRVASEYSQRLIKQYGADSDVVRVRVMGEFPKAEADGVIALEEVEAAMAREPSYTGEVVIGVDVARFGDDYSALIARCGDSVWTIEKYRKADLMTTCGRVLHLLEKTQKEWGRQNVKINVDETGLGGGLVDRLREVLREKNLRAQVTGCNNGGKPRDAHYNNYGSEMYFALRERFAEGKISLPPNDELAAQLTTRKYRLNSRDQLTLESKAEYKKRHKQSPDLADALALCFAPTLQVSAPQFVATNSYWR